MYVGNIHGVASSERNNVQCVVALIFGVEVKGSGRVGLFCYLIILWLEGGTRGVGREGALIGGIFFFFWCSFCFVFLFFSHSP